MKKAEKIYQNNYNLDKDEDGNEVCYKYGVLDAIREAQKDAIKSTIKECVNNIKLTNYTHNGRYTPYPVLDIQSILSVEDKLIKKL